MCGEATIINNISGELKEYKVQIEKIYLDDITDNKSFVIRVLDKSLIDETGGIIRGLSRKSNSSKRKINWYCYKCVSVKSMFGVWSICRFSFRKHEHLLICNMNKL